MESWRASLKKMKSTCYFSDSGSFIRFYRLEWRQRGLKKFGRSKSCQNRFLTMEYRISQSTTHKTLWLFLVMVGLRLRFYEKEACCCLVAKSCLTLVTPWTVACQALLSMKILQARILEWVAIFFSRESSQPRNQTPVSCIAGRFFTNWATREATF